MADDVGGEDDTVVIQQRIPRRKKESMWGNIAEAALTYMSGLFIFLPVHAILIFGPWEFSTPESQAVFWPIWIAFALTYYAANAIAAVIGTQARFSSKTWRFFADMGSSASPLVLPILMIILTVVGAYHPTRMDFLIAFFMSAISLIDLLAHSNLVQTAVRRVREGFVDS